MNEFPRKRFEGKIYEFSHLKPLKIELSLLPDNINN